MNKYVNVLTLNEIPLKIYKTADDSTDAMIAYYGLIYDNYFKEYPIDRNVDWPQFKENMENNINSFTDDVLKMTNNTLTKTDVIDSVRFKNFSTDDNYIVVFAEKPKNGEGEDSMISTCLKYADPSGRIYRYYFLGGLKELTWQGLKDRIQNSDVYLVAEAYVAKEFSKIYGNDKIEVDSSGWVINIHDDLKPLFNKKVDEVVTQIKVY